MALVKRGLFPLKISAISIGQVTGLILVSPCCTIPATVIWPILRKCCGSVVDQLLFKQKVLGSVPKISSYKNQVVGNVEDSDKP